MEIEYALELEKVVIPVLVNDVVMPRRDEVPLSLEHLLRRNALLARHVSWDADIDELVRAVRQTAAAQRG